MKRRSAWPRVLIVRPDLPEGQDTRGWNECHTLLAAGYEVAVIGPPTQVVLKGLRYYPRRLRQGLLAGPRTCAVTWGLCLRALMEHGFQVLQWSGPPAGLWAVAAPFRLLGKRLVYDQRDAAATRRGPLWLQGMERLSRQVAHRVVVGAPDDADGPGRPSPVVPVPSGPRPLVLRRTPEPALRRGMPYLCCGIVPVEGRRGGEMLVRTWAELVHTLGRQEIGLAVLTSPATTRRLQPLVERLRLRGHVALVPHTDLLCLSRYLSTAQVAVCADDDGPLPDAVLCGGVETAMSARLPHAVFDVAGLLTVTQGSALYAPSGDVLALARCVGALVDDAALRVRMGREAELRVRALLQWRLGAPGYIRVFDDLLGIPPYDPVVVLARAGASGSEPRYVVRPDSRHGQRRQEQRRRQPGPVPPTDRRQGTNRRKHERRVQVPGATGGRRGA